MCVCVCLSLSLSVCVCFFFFFCVGVWGLGFLGFRGLGFLGVRGYALLVLGSPVDFTNTAQTTVDDANPALPIIEEDTIVPIV